MKCENMTMQCWVTQTCFGLTQGEWLMGTHGEWHMGTLEAVELGHAREVTRLGHPDICYHEITNPNINLVHFSLQPKNLKCTSLAIQCQNGQSVIIYSTIIQLCFVLFWFICSLNPKIYGPTWLGFVPMPHRMPTNSKFDAWGFTWAKFTFTFQLETTFIRKRRLNIIKQSCILFPPKWPLMSFLAMWKLFPGHFYVWESATKWLFNVLNCTGKSLC